jgi:hypothetical protein
MPGSRRTPAQGVIPGMGAPRPIAARARKGLEAQLKAQRAAGTLADVDDSLIAVARTLADALDLEAGDPEGSRYTLGSLAGRLVPVLLELRGVRHDAGGDIDQELAALITAVRDGAQPDA